MIARAAKCAAGCAVICIVITQTPATAQGVGVYTLGQESCGLFLEAYERRDEPLDIRYTQFHAFMSGYMTAFNFFAEERFPVETEAFNILNDTQVVAQDAFLANYCRENPLDLFYEAIDELIDELLRRR